MKAVFFDVGGTLLQPWPSVGAVYARVGERHGFVASAAAMEQAFRVGWHKGKTTDGELTSSDKEWWQRLVFDVLDTLQLGGTGPARTAYFEELYATFADGDAWRLFPDGDAALRRARTAGLHVGLISNWDTRLRPLLRSMGLTQRVDSITISCEAGMEKPDPGIFHAALRAAGVPAGEALHVGDDLEADVRGAEAVGIAAVLIDRGRDTHGTGRSISDLRQLAFDGSAR